MSNTAIAKIPLGGYATYRPGVKTVKPQANSKTYAVAHGAVLVQLQDRCLRRQDLSLLMKNN